MIEQILSHIPASLPWAAVQVRQGAVSSAEIQDVARIAVQLNPALADMDVPKRGGGEVVFKAVCGELFGRGLGLEIEQTGVEPVCPVDLGLDSGEFPIMADAKLVMDIRRDGRRDTARRLAIAIGLLDGFVFWSVLDWWIESKEEWLADEDDEDSQACHLEVIEKLRAIQQHGKWFIRLYSIIHHDRHGAAFVARFRQEVEAWQPDDTVPAHNNGSDVEWREWIMAVQDWHSQYHGLLHQIEPSDNGELEWHDLVGFGWDDPSFWEEYDGMVNSRYEGSGIGDYSVISVTPENVMETIEKRKQWDMAFGGLCRLVSNFSAITREQG